MIIANYLSIIKSWKCASALAMVLATAAISVCGGEDERAHGANVSSTSQALNGVFAWTATTTMDHLSDPVFVDLGINDGWTCWLGGAFGNLLQGSWVSVDQSDGTFSFDNITRGHWVLSFDGVPGANIRGTADCGALTEIPDAGANLFGPNLSSNILTNATPDQLCGLSTIFVDDSGQWNGSSSFAAVVNHGGTKSALGPTWTLGVGNGLASARCAGMPSGQHFSSFSSHSVSPQNPTTGPLTFPGGTTCFLSNVSGGFKTNSVTNGAGWATIFNADGTSTWTLTASNGTSAVGVCIL